MNAKPDVQLPAVSVIMPVLDEERHLRGAVQAILAQEYAGEMEVVIALGPSTDRTDEIAAQLFGRPSAAWRAWRKRRTAGSRSRPIATS